MNRTVRLHLKSLLPEHRIGKRTSLGAQGPPESLLILRHLLENGLFEGEFRLLGVRPSECTAFLYSRDSRLNGWQLQRLAIDDPGS